MRTKKKRFDETFLADLRKMEVEEALLLLNIPYKADRTYRPRLDPDSKRLLVSMDYVSPTELLVTRQKWFSSQKKIGGGGAIDLVMFLFKVDFVTAVKKLEKSCEDRNKKNTKDQLYKEFAEKEG